MASRPVLVLGNIASMVLTIVALLQLLSWTIAGLLILSTLTLSTLAPSRESGGARPPSRKSMVHAATVEMRQRERPVEKTVPHTHPGPARIESKPVSRHELVRPVAPQPKPDQAGAVPASSSRPGSQRQESLKTVPPKIVPPRTVPSTFSPSKPVPPEPGRPKQESSRPVTPKINPPSRQSLATSDSGRSPTIGKGDFERYDVELDEGAEVTCTITANGQVNVYLLDGANLNSLDAGEEFWSETGEEDVEKAVLNFIAPERGRWFLVVENAGSKEISATVNIEKSNAKIRTSQALDPNMDRRLKPGLG